MKKNLRTLVPESLISLYHLFLAYFGAWYYQHPSRHLMVIGVTGTKGKSSVTEMVNAILEEAGYKTALLNSIRIKILQSEERNTMRMSMPGRFYIQRFLRDAVDSGCTVAVLEMTSEGARQNRHRAIEMDALIFTNLAPEHIESHGSYEKYAAAKLELGKQLVRSKKATRYMVANADDAQSVRYLSLNVERPLPFSLKDVAPYAADDHGAHFTFDGATITISLPGEFSIKNALAAATLAHALKIPTETIAMALRKLAKIPGRAERIEVGQKFAVVVDYAHTPDSLQALYDAYGSSRKICVMGATGGGRDAWKRPVMGGIAEKNCDVVILTNEDPYDENPLSIVQGIAGGMTRTPEIVMDRREAISKAFEIALSLDSSLDGTRDNQNGIAVLITGKGTDPCICGPQGEKIPWSDAQVAQEELQKLQK